LQSGDPSLPFNHQLAAAVFDSTDLPESDDGAFIAAPEDLTDDQKEAVKRALRNKSTYLWGPPGTGKTVTLAAIAWQLFRDNKRVLLVSQTNLAVDGVVEVLCKRIVGKARLSLPEGCVLRLGAIARKNLQQVFGEQISIESVAESQKRKVEERIATVRKERESNAKELELIRERLGLAARQEVLEQEIRNLEGMYAQARSSESALKTVLRVLRIRYGSDSQGSAGVDDLKRSLSVARSELVDVASALNGTSRRELDETFADLEKRDSDLSEAIEDLRGLGADAVGSALARARVVACTASQALLRARNLGEFDAVVIDEGAMLPLPLVFFLSGLASEKVVIGGDFRQLPPISISHTPLVKRWYARDIFEASGVVDGIDRGEESSRVAMLTTQFRGHETLCSLINQRFYGGRLVSKVALPPGVKVEGVPEWLAEHNVLLVDTAGLNPVGFYQGKSKGNITHALVAQRLCSALTEAGLAEAAGDVGVIAPYRPQVSLLEDLIKEAGLQNISVGTVHRFQGAERRSVIVDLTESEPHTPGAFLGARDVRETGARLLNVALSRAQMRLFLVVNTAHVRAHLSSEHILTGIVDELSSRGAIIAAERLIPDADSVSVPNGDRAGSAPSRIQRFDASSFIAGVSADLAVASHSVTVIAGDVSLRAAYIFATLVKPLIARGVTCSVLCGAVEEENAEAVSVLSDGGVSVTCGVDVIVSAVLIDREIVWTGASTVLSDPDSLVGPFIRAVSSSSARRIEALYGSSLATEPSMPVAANAG
jgi:hypothetical protein